MSVQPQTPLVAPRPGDAVPAAGDRASAAGVLPDAAAKRTDGDEAIGPPPAPVWLQRLSLGVLVVFCLYLGLLIAVLPWWPDMWDRNALLLQHPALRLFLLKGSVRGLISGLGMLDLWIGISELIHYRDYRN